MVQLKCCCANRKASMFLSLGLAHTTSSPWSLAWTPRRTNPSSARWTWSAAPWSPRTSSWAAPAPSRCTACVNPCGSPTWWVWCGVAPRSVVKYAFILRFYNQWPLKLFTIVPNIHSFMYTFITYTHRRQWWRKVGEATQGHLDAQLGGAGDHRSVGIIKCVLLSVIIG